MTTSSPLVKVDITSLGEGVNVKFAFPTTHTNIDLPLPNPVFSSGYETGRRA